MVLVADEICISSLIWDVKKNTRRLRKNTRGEKKIRGAKKKYASTKTKIRVQIILVQMEQHSSKSKLWTRITCEIRMNIERANSPEFPLKLTYEGVVSRCA
jgi:hypothetical protein